MPLNKYVCWNPERIGQVVRIDAEAARDPEFLAVHSEYPISYGPNLESSSNYATEEPQEFLDRFLDESRVNQRIAIVGESGSGKSHFIRWMRVNIPETPTRKVFSIQRAQVSLQSVLGELISLLPEDDRDEYLQILNRGGGASISPDQRREKLTTSLAQAIIESSPNDASKPIEQWLHRGLSDMFHDPFVRSKTTADGSFVHRLADHVFERNSQYERRNESYEFEISDMPSLGQEIEKCSEPVQKFLGRLISASQLREQAVTVVNEAMDSAIQRALEFTGDRLIELLTNIRKSLGKHGVQLILLIEDLARLQGIDMALLLALSAETDDPEICEMRWAVAVTRGYYSTMPRSFRTRVLEVVDMDRSSIGVEAVENQDKLASFTAAYLRAVRTDGDDLKSWFDDSDRAASPPNSCDDCPFRAECHQYFGEIDGVGLYPFTKDAISNMANRASSEEFTPRSLLSQMLLSVLNDHQRISAGRFPHENLVRSLGGPRVPVEVREEISRTQDEGAELVESIIELYSKDPTIPLQVSEGVWKTFGVEQVTLDFDAPKPEPKPEDSGLSKPESDPIVTALERWSAEETLQSSTVRDLRRLVFDWLNYSVDWDALGYERTRMTGSNGVFRQERIQFRNMTAGRRGGRNSPGTVVLTLPLTDSKQDLQRTVLALQTFQRYSKQGNWSFDSAARQYQNAMGELAKWRQHLLDSIQALTSPSPDWSPIDTAVDLLACGAVMSGRVSNSRPDLGDFLAGMLSDWPDPDSTHTREWIDVYTELRSKQQDLISILFWLGGAGKGGSVSTLDPSKIVPALRSFLRRWGVDDGAPQDSELEHPDLRLLSSLSEKIVAAMPEAINNEIAVRKAWHERTQEAFGSEWKRNDVLESLKSLTEAVSNTGFPVKNNVSRKMGQLVEEFGNAQVDAALRNIRAIVDSADEPSVISQLGTTLGLNAIRVTENLIEIASEYTEAIDQELENKGVRGDDTDESVDRNIKLIHAGIESVKDDLTGIVSDN
jgi:hypothetical protein